MSRDRRLIWTRAVLSNRPRLIQGIRDFPSALSLWVLLWSWVARLVLKMWTGVWSSMPGFQDPFFVSEPCPPDLSLMLLAFPETFIVLTVTWCSCIYFYWCLFCMSVTLAYVYFKNHMWILTELHLCFLFSVFLWHLCLVSALLTFGVYWEFYYIIVMLNVWYVIYVLCSYTQSKN